MLALEVIDLNGSQTMFSLTNKLNLEVILPSKISIWKLRCNNPMRKSFNSINIKIDEFEALLKLTSEMSKELYPYIRAILSSKDNYKITPQLWNDFRLRYKELIEERFNTESIRVRNLIDINNSEILFTRILLTLALSVSEEGYIRLKTSIFNL